MVSTEFNLLRYGVVRRRLLAESLKSVVRTSLQFLSKLTYLNYISRREEGTTSLRPWQIVQTWNSLHSGPFRSSLTTTTTTGTESISSLSLCQRYFNRSCSGFGTTLFLLSDCETCSLKNLVLLIKSFQRVQFWQIYLNITMEWTWETSMPSAESCSPSSLSTCSWMTSTSWLWTCTWWMRRTPLQRSSCRPYSNLLCTFSFSRVL